MSQVQNFETRQDRINSVRKFLAKDLAKVDAALEQAADKCRAANAERDACRELRRILVEACAALDMVMKVAPPPRSAE